MKKTYFIYFLFAAYLLLGSACTGKFEKIRKSTDYEKKYRAAMNYYDNKKYQKSATLFDDIRLYYRGSSRDDTINFYLPKSYFLDKDPMLASSYFSAFRQSFPRSLFTEEASYLYCLCLYKMTYRVALDPNPTMQALAAMNEFYYTYPSSPWREKITPLHEELLGRMDEKAYLAAKLYYDIEYYKSAIAALKTVLKDNPDNRYRENMLYLILSSTRQIAKNSVESKQRERYQTVIDEYYNVISEYPESKYRKEVDAMYQEAQKFLEKK
ncbi:MAG: outer membrane protein assembly factor BamD [Prevotellaceae bacterium]|nr:outer membrane protein assembly factor BamD [Prevotellaceae bacterium]